MNKLLQKVARIFLGLSMAAGVGVAVGSNSKKAELANAANSTYSVTLDNHASGNNNIHIVSSTSTNLDGFTYNSATWSISQTWSGSSYYGTAKGVAQWGSQKNPATSLTFETSYFANKIVKNVIVTGYCTSNAGPTISITAGSTPIISDVSIVKTTSTDYKRASDTSVTMGSSDKITISISSSVGAGLCFSKIQVIYENPTYYSVTYKANGGTGSDKVYNNILSGTSHELITFATSGFEAPTGKQFKCWSLDSAEKNPGYQFNVTADKNVLAVWEDLPSGPSVSLSLTSGSPAYKGSTVTVSAATSNLEGTGLTWTVTAGSVTGISSSNSSFSGTLASTGTVTIKAQDNGGDTYNTVSVTVNAVTVSLSESAISVDQSGTSSLTATVNTGSVIWSSNNAKVTVEADSGNALKGNISVAGDATVGSTAVITATSIVDSSVKATCTLTVSENPFASFIVVKSTSEITTTGVYVFSNDGTHYIGNTVANSYISYPITSSNPEDLGYFRFETATNGYYLKYVEKNPQTGVWEDKSSNKYVNNGSSTSMSWSGTASSIWTLNATGSGDSARVYIKNSSNSSRHLGLNGNSPSTATQVRAYASSNISSNLPVYIYEVPQNKLDGLTISGQTTTFTAGSTFSLGNNAVLTAHYSSTGNTNDLSGGTISYKINNVTVPANTVLDHDTHNGKSVVITYTDAAGDVASTTAYTITVNYKPAGSISLNLDSAPLSIGGSVSLTATVGDEYADENDVSWSTTSAGIASISAASGTKTITVTGVSAGSATITATANGHSATCAISVTADPILNLKDSGDNIINDETLEFFTGDDSVMIQAVSENVASPVYSWENEDDSVVIIDAADEYCEVTIVGAGNSEVSVTVGALTRTVTFSVTASGVTALTLTSSVDEGVLWTGSYLHTLTLTPNITKQGNATNVINWSSDDTSVATVSSAQTSGTAITVTGVGAGTTVITAQSDYTPATYVEYTVTVKAEGVKSLTWASKPTLNANIYANETTLGAAITAGGGYGTFTAKWNSGMADTNPTYGTTAGTVHFALYDSTTPSSEGTPLSADYVFQKSDNGKYIVPFFEGTRCSHNVQVTVINWRSVKESNTSTALYDFSSISASSTQAMSSDTFNGYYQDSSTLAQGSSAVSKIYADSSGSIKGGASSSAASITITFEESVEISSVTIVAKRYSQNESNLNLMGNVIALTDSMAEYTLTVADEDFETTNIFSLTTSNTSTNKRCYIESITIVAGGEQEIGKTSDCLGLEVYIDTYLHMNDYTSSQGWCKDEEHNYYGKNTETGAKYHFNQLNAHQRSLLSSNSAYAAEWARLSAWAAANGESLNSSTLLAARQGISPLVNIIGENTNTVAIIVIISMVSVTAIGGYFFLRKRKEN